MLIANRSQKWVFLVLGFLAVKGAVPLYPVQSNCSYRRLVKSLSQLEAMVNGNVF